MAFWSWTPRRIPAGDDGSAALAPQQLLEPIQLFTSESRISGWIAPNGERVTDLLNAQPRLRVWVSTAAGQGSWESIDRDQVLLVAPPPHATQRQRRVHRSKHRVSATVGHYEAIGTAYLIPGIPLDPYLLRTRQAFLPMTGVWLRDTEDPAFEQQLDVAILNVGNLTQLRELLTLS